VTGRKNDKGKLEWHLLPRRLLKGTVRVLMFGKALYGEFNWQKLDNPKIRYMDALERHIEAHQSGEKFDKESGQSHLDHAICDLLFLKYFELRDEEANKKL